MIIGGAIAWIGIVSAVFITVPQYHRALTMKDDPVEMTWQELVDNGLTDNSYVRLVGIDLDNSGSLSVFEDMLGHLDPNADPEDQINAFEDAAENIDFGDFADAITKPIKVFPKGEDPDQFPPRIVVPQSGWAMDVAYQQLEESGALTGRFTLSQGEGFHAEMASMLLSKAAEAAEQAAQQARDSHAEPAAIEPAADHDSLSRSGDVESVDAKVGSKALDSPPSDDLPRYVFEPVDEAMSRTDASQCFWFSGMAVAVGLVICGAGGPSLPCCIFFQGAALLSLLGYPMRYGRASKMTRILYAFVGILLISYGYQKMIVEGQFGQINANLPLAVLGFMAGSVGGGALLGSVTSVVAERLNVSLEPKSTKKNPEPKINFTQACSLQPDEAQMSSRYVDLELVDPADVPIEATCQERNASLMSVGFGPCEVLSWMQNDEVQSTYLQLGCQEMVVADIESVEGESIVRMASVLLDGMTIITLSSNSKAASTRRMGTNGLYSVAESDDPVEMLSAHLERTVTMAEQRGTAVVQIEPSEMTDIALLWRRVLADVQTQYGEANTEVGHWRYGRFGFPVTEIPQPSLV